MPRDAKDKSPNERDSFLPLFYESNDTKITNIFPTLLFFLYIIPNYAIHCSAFTII